MEDLKLLTERKGVILKNMEYALKYGNYDKYLSYKRQLDELTEKNEKLNKVKESLSHPYFF